MNEAKHREVIDDFLKYMNELSRDYILKGGTSLMTCYGLDRMSEDIDLDSINKEKIDDIIHSFCKDRGYTYNVNKNTDTVKRFMIHYDKDEGDHAKPLKVEISYRKQFISKEDYSIRNGITVYNIDQIAIMKANAFSQRDKIRDLYDLVFICKNYKNQLDKNIQTMIRDGFENKGLEYFDYITQTQKDELIDTDKLAGDLLEVFDDFGLITNNVEKESKMMESARQEFFARPKEARVGGIKWQGTSYRVAEFEDMYLAQCQKEGREPLKEIKDHFWGNCVNHQDYTPIHCSKNIGLSR